MEVPSGSCSRRSSPSSIVIRPSTPLPSVARWKRRSARPEHASRAGYLHPRCAGQYLKGEDLAAVVRNSRGLSEAEVAELRLQLTA